METNKDLSYIDRMEIELKELGEKIDKLGKFINRSDAFTGLTRKEQYLLKKQYSIMRNYYDVLYTRINYSKTKEKEE